MVGVDSAPDKSTLGESKHSAMASSLSKGHSIIETLAPPRTTESRSQGTSPLASIFDKSSNPSTALSSYSTSQSHSPSQSPSPKTGPHGKYYLALGNVKVYPESNIQVPLECKIGFENVVNILRINVERKIGSQAGEIIYEQLMCCAPGKPPRPAVVVRCRNELVSQVQKVLTKSWILEECELIPLADRGKLLLLELFSSPRKSQLGLVFKACGETTASPPTRTLLRGSIDGVDNNDVVKYDPFFGNSPLCGAKVIGTTGKGLATVTCVLQIGEKFYGLTTAHAFQDVQKSVVKASGNTILDSIEPSTSQNENGHEELSNINPLEDSHFTIPALILLGISVTPIQTELSIPESSCFSMTEPNLDWALLNVQNKDMLREGKRLALDSAATSLNIHKTARAHPNNNVEVYVLTSMETRKRGALLPGSSFRTEPGNAMVETWSVSLSEGAELEHGDSGALVVDATTGVAYGYVVARDTYGRAEIIPLHRVLKQLRDFADVDHVGLANVENQNEENSTVKGKDPATVRFQPSPSANVRDEKISPASANRRGPSMQSTRLPNFQPTSSSTFNQNEDYNQSQRIKDPAYKVTQSSDQGLAMDFPLRSRPLNETRSAQMIQPYRKSATTKSPLFVAYLVSPYKDIDSDEPFWDRIVPPVEIPLTQDHLAEFVEKFPYDENDRSLNRRLTGYKAKHVWKVVAEQNLRENRAAGMEWNLVSIKFRYQYVVQIKPFPWVSKTVTAMVIVLGRMERRRRSNDVSASSSAEDLYHKLYQQTYKVDSKKYQRTGHQQLRSTDVREYNSANDNAQNNRQSYSYSGEPGYNQRSTATENLARVSSSGPSTGRRAIQSSAVEDYSADGQFATKVEQMISRELDRRRDEKRAKTGAADAQGKVPPAASLYSMSSDESWVIERPQSRERRRSKERPSSREGPRPTLYLENHDSYFDDNVRGAEHEQIPMPAGNTKTVE